MKKISVYCLFSGDFKVFLLCQHYIPDFYYTESSHYFSQLRTTHASTP